jgi:hypothetical protein
MGSPTVYRMGVKTITKFFNLKCVEQDVAYLKYYVDVCY